MVDQVLNKDIDFQTMSNEKINFYKLESKNSREERIKITDEYFKLHSEFFDLVITSVNDFKDNSKQYLRN